jgi:flagellar basal body-associated protein FliL
VGKKTKIDPVQLEAAQSGKGAPENRAEGKETGTDVPELKKKRSSLVFILGGVLFLGGGIGAAGYLGYLPLPWVSPAGTSEAKPAEPAAIGPTVKLSPLVINLKEDSGRSYLKTSIIFEVGRKEEAEELQKRLSILTDMVILIVSDKRLDQLKQIDFKENLKKELLTSVQKESDLRMIRGVYFDEFLFQ